MCTWLNKKQYKVNSLSLVVFAWPQNYVTRDILCMCKHECTFPTLLKKKNESNNNVLFLTFLISHLGDSTIAIHLFGHAQ